MKPNRFGRILGIGVRVASRMAKERATARTGNKSSQKPQTRATTPQAAPPRPSAPPPRPAKNYTEPARRIGVGTRRFTKAVGGPLAHISGTLWLEITGLFFALFAAFFGQIGRAHV